MQDIRPVSTQELEDDDDISVEQRIFIRDLADKGYMLIHTPPTSKSKTQLSKETNHA